MKKSGFWLLLLKQQGVGCVYYDAAQNKLFVLETFKDAGGVGLEVEASFGCVQDHEPCCLITCPVPEIHLCRHWTEQGFVRVTDAGFSRGDHHYAELQALKDCLRRRVESMP